MNTFSEWQARAHVALAEKTKPVGSLGRLESIAAQLAGIQGTLDVRADRGRMLVFAASHGVAAAGVSAYPGSVTAQMVANFLRGGAAINVLCRVAGLDLVVIDAGVEDRHGLLPASAPGLIRSPIAAGTANFAAGPAMTLAQVEAAWKLGGGVVEDAHSAGIEVLAVGEMGIGNTTSAAALCAGLLILDPANLVGTGTGVDEDALERKFAVVEKALALYEVTSNSPADWLAAVGGFEIAAMAGAVEAAWQLRVPLIIDGFIATAAVVAAWRKEPRVLEACFFSHCSAELGHELVLDELGVEPLLDLDLRLGEGTGAALAWPLLRSAAHILTDMATFAEAGVDQSESPA